jgi:hypothetical protein
MAGRWNKVAQIPTSRVGRGLLMTAPTAAQLKK